MNATQWSATTASGHYQILFLWVFPGYVQLVVVPLLPARLPPPLSLPPQVVCPGRRGWPHWHLAPRTVAQQRERCQYGSLTANLSSEHGCSTWAMLPALAPIPAGERACAAALFVAASRRAVPVFIGGACAIKGPTCLMGSDPVQVDFRGHQQVTIASHLPPLPPAFLFSIGFQYFSPLFNRGFVLTGYLLMSVRNILIVPDLPKRDDAANDYRKCFSLGPWLNLMLTNG